MILEIIQTSTLILQSIDHQMSKKKEAGDPAKRTFELRRIIKVREHLYLWSAVDATLLSPLPCYGPLTVELRRIIKLAEESVWTMLLLLLLLLLLPLTSLLHNSAWRRSTPTKCDGIFSATLSPHGRIYAQPHIYMLF